MVFNINEFKSQVASRGLAKNNLFMARITVPQSMSYLEQYIPTRDMSFLCKSVSLPSFDLNYAEVRPQGFGKPEKRPLEFHGGDLIGTFMMDSNFATMKFFHRWMQTITNIGSYGGNFTPDANGKLPYEFAYKEEYAATMEVLVYSSNDANRVYQYKFGNVFPMTIGGMDVSWENQAEIMTLPVNFAYDKLAVDGFELGEIATSLQGSNGLLTYASSFYGFIQAINQLSTPNSIQDLINQATTVNTIFNAL